MKRLLMLFVIAALATVGGVLFATSEPASNVASEEVELPGGFSLPDENSACGVVPVRPVPPPGCRDLVAQCTCDASGRNCHWTWVCVP